MGICTGKQTHRLKQQGRRWCVNPELEHCVCVCVFITAAGVTAATALLSVIMSEPQTTDQLEEDAPLQRC